MCFKCVKDGQREAAERENEEKTYSRLTLLHVEPVLVELDDVGVFHLHQVLKHLLDLLLKNMQTNRRGVKHRGKLDYGSARSAGIMVRSVTNTALKYQIKPKRIHHTSWGATIPPVL